MRQIAADSLNPSPPLASLVGDHLGCHIDEAVGDVASAPAEPTGTGDVDGASPKRFNYRPYLAMLVFCTFVVHEAGNETCPDWQVHFA